MGWLRQDTRRKRHGKIIGSHNGMWYAEGYSYVKNKYRRAIRRYWKRFARINVGLEDEAKVPEQSVPNLHSEVGWKAL